MNPVTLNHWSAQLGLQYVPPQTQRSTLAGVCQNHPKHKDGTELVTSIIKGKRSVLQEWTIVTKSGTSYQLGSIDPAYERLFPNAKIHLFNALKEV